MDRKSKIIITFLLIVTTLLFVVLTAVASYRIASYDNFQLKTELGNVQKTQDILLSKISKIESNKPSNGQDGIDGNTPKKGIDYRDGSDSVSKDTVVVKETPLKGKDGLSAYQIAVKNGFNGTELDWINSLKPITQDFQVNPINGDFEIKLSNGDYWATLIPCNRLLVGCS